MASSRVLIVDDQSDVRRVLRAALETLGQGIQVIDVPSGEEALLVTDRQAIDVLVADVRLPGISGLELIQRAQARNPGLKLVLVTGLTDPKIKRQVSDSGAEAVFFKPVKIGDFLAAIQSCLGLPVDAPVAGGKAAPAITTAERLAALRQEFGAAWVALCNASGHWLDGAGSLPGEAFRSSLSRELQQVLTTRSIVSQFLEDEVGESLTWYPGSTLDHILIVSEKAAALLMAVPASSNHTVVRQLEPLRRAARELLAEVPGSSELSVEGVQATVDVAEQAVETGALLELEALLEQGSNQQLPPTAVEAFWDSAGEAAAGQDAANEAVNSSTLSYEAARRLGLLPDDQPE